MQILDGNHKMNELTDPWFHIIVLEKNIKGESKLVIKLVRISSFEYSRRRIHRKT